MVAPVLVAGYFRARQDTDTLRPLGAFAVLYFLFGMLPYPIVARYLVGIRTFGEFYGWLLGTSEWGAWGAWRLTTLPATVIGLIRTFTGSHYLLALKPVAQFAERTFSAASLLDEMAIAAWGPRWLRLSLLPIQATVLAFAAKSLAGGPRRLKHMLRAERAFGLFLIAWITILGLFFVWWAPERVDFWIAWLPALIIVLAFPVTGESGSRPTGLAATVAFLAGLFAVNFFGSIYPQSGPISERDTETAVAIDAVVNAGDIVISDSYFAGRASKYAGSFDRVNLLDAVLAYPSRAEGTIYVYRDGRSREVGFNADVADTALMTQLEARTLARLDSLVGIAAEEGRAVFLLVSPVANDAGRRRTYSELVDVIGSRYDLSDVVQLRGQLDMRRIPTGDMAK
jgi:hypothetical protein